MLAARIGLQDGARTTSVRSVGSDADGGSALRSTSTPSPSSSRWSACVPRRSSFQVDERRSASREPDAQRVRAERPLDPAEEAERSELRQTLAATIDSLPPVYRLCARRSVRAPPF